MLCPYRSSRNPFVRRQQIPLGVLCVLLAVPLTAKADGVIRDGLGARSCGRGATNLAFADNGVILLDNPAGMVNVEGCGLCELGFDVLFADLSYTDPDQVGYVIAESHPLPTAEGALIRKSSDGTWAYGLGIYAPAGFSSDYELQGPYPLVGTRRYRAFGALGRILPAAAFHLSDRLSLGATLGVAVSYVEMEGPYFFQAPGPIQGVPTVLDLRSTGAAPSWSVGAQYQLTPATTLGLAYQGATELKMGGRARVEAPVVGESGFDAHLDLTWPRWLGLGIRHELCPHRVVAADVIWYDWSSAFDQLRLGLTSPSNPLVAMVAGPSLQEEFPLHWRDSVSVRVGYEQHWPAGRVMRLGYVYHRNPIPNEMLTPFIQTTLEHTFSIGYGWSAGCWEVDLAYQYSFSPEISVGTSSLLGGDFSSSRHHTQVHVALISLIRPF
jgi:long-chain fatty acid transport protein